jgi:predicted small integral membrane protein
MKRLFVSVLSGAAVLGISWLSGVDFDQRGEAMAASIAVALFFAVGVYVAYGVHE